jgi:hypothetical protein
MKKVRWIIQDSNYSNKDRQQLITACAELGLPSVEIAVIPFAKELPPFPLDKEYENIYYGSTTMMDCIYEHYNQPLGLFYDATTFSMENYLKQWGKYMLSSEAIFTTFEAFSTGNHPEEQEFFLRPDADSKAFAGIVLKFGAIKEWYKNLTNDDLYGLGPDTKIMTGPAYHIEKEWRNYIVNGKVVTSSAYRKNFQLYKSATDIPAEMIAFVEARCKEYQPHAVFAMDVAKCSGTHEYYIIECGCMNSVGFYSCDIFQYVKALSNYVEELSFVQE